MNTPALVLELAGCRVTITGAHGFVAVQIGAARVELQLPAAGGQQAHADGHEEADPMGVGPTPSGNGHQSADPMGVGPTPAPRGERSDRPPAKVGPTPPETPSESPRSVGVGPTPAAPGEGSVRPPCTPRAAAAAVVASVQEQHGSASALASAPGAGPPPCAPRGARARAGEREGPDEPGVGPTLAGVASTLPDPTPEGGWPPALSPDGREELLAVARHLRDAIRLHRPGIEPPLDPWLEDLRHAVVQDDRRPYQLAQAAWFAHSARDADGTYFWRQRVLSGATLRKHAGELLRQLAVAPLDGRGPRVPACPRCWSLRMVDEPEIPVLCEHRTTWVYVRRFTCAACKGGMVWWRGHVRCSESRCCDGGVPDTVARQLAALRVRLEVGAPAHAERPS